MQPPVSIRPHQRRGVPNDRRSDDDTTADHDSDDIDDVDDEWRATGWLRDPELRVGVDLRQSALLLLYLPR